MPLAVAGARTHRPDNTLANSLLIGGGAATVIGGGAGGHAVWARTHVGQREAKLLTEQHELAAATQQEAAARAALATDRLHPPAGTSADDALAWAKQRFGAGAGYARTEEGTRRDLQITRWGTPVHEAADATAGAHQLADGRAGALIRAGEWQIPVRFDSDLDPLEKTRSVPRTTSKYTYGLGYNPATGKTEGYWGMHPVTEWVDEEYRDPFNRVVAPHDGLNGAFTDSGTKLRTAGTPFEFAVNDAVDQVAREAADVGDVGRALSYSRSGTSAIVRNVGLGVAALGLAAVGASFLTRDDS